MTRYLVSAACYGAALAVPLAIGARIMRGELPPFMMVAAAIAALVLPVVGFVVFRMFPE